MFRAESDQATEGTDCVSIRFVVGIAEGEVGSTRVADQREVDHLAGIAGIERPGHHRFLDGENCGVNADTKRQGQDRHRRKPGLAV